MTYAIVARCPATGQFGIAVASYSLAIGRHCDGALRAHTGVALTLGNPNPRNNYLAINLLAQGNTAAQALATARDAGGLTSGSGRLPERSAALIVWGSRPHNEIDLRVDLHEDAIADLKRIYVDYKPSIAYYEERAKSPRNAVPAMEFVEKLEAGRREEAR